MDTIIEAQGVTKNYGRVEALGGLDLRVPAGSIYGFLGRNGAGKTTTIKLLLGMARPSGGAARVFGLAPTESAASVEIRRRTGFVAEDKGLYDYMTVDQLIRFTRAFFPGWRDDLERQYLRDFELPPDRKVKALSKGMRTKLCLLLALAHAPELLVLDEPTSGLDPAMSEQVLQTLVGHVTREGATIFFSSHQLAEVDQIADHVTIIERGRAVVSGPLEDLKQNYRRVVVVFDGDAAAVELRTPGIEQTSRQGRTVSLLASRNADAIAAEARSLGPISVEVIPVTLKEIFLETVKGREA